MATDVATPRDEKDMSNKEKLELMRELFAEAPEVGKSALERVLAELEARATKAPPKPGRHSPGQGLGADDHRPHRARRRGADARVPAAARRQP
jgi:hypothetical protein